MSRFQLCTTFFFVSCLAITAPAADFYPILDVSVDAPDGGADFYPIFNLIQGPGVGYEEDDPHDAFAPGADTLWVTQACGFPCSYIDSFGEPIIFFDLGTDRDLTEISVWGYSETNSNGLREFSLRFATDAEGPDGYGTSITYNPNFEEVEIFPIERQSFPFNQDVSARYVEMTAIDNYFEDPGDGTGEEGFPPGGDRVGLGEVAFEAPGPIDPPDPPDGIQFHDIASIESTTQDFDLYPVDNLIQGPVAGFRPIDPYQKTATGAAGNWVTEACGFPCDYLEAFDEPVLTIDLGEDVDLSEINLWGYDQGNANGVSEFSLRFATEADGENGFGNSIDYNPTFSDLENNSTDRLIFPFDQTLTARYVELTATDNFFEEPGDGSNGETPGGDRIGLGEIAFPKPGSLGLPGDFNMNGELDVEDVNLLSAEVKAGTNDEQFDLNNDMVVDLEDHRIWVKDLKNTWYGDANLDGEFGSGDLVVVFTAGKYEQDVDATWDEGDWNADLRFGSGDMVVAFTDGGFELGPVPSVAAVPEPSALLLLALGILGIVSTVRRKA